MVMIVNSTEWFPREQNNAGNWAPVTGSDVTIVSAGEFSVELTSIVNFALQATGDPVPQWRVVDTPAGNVVGTKGFPPGLGISTSGHISGTVNGSVGVYTATVQAYNSFSSANKIIRFNVVAANTGAAPVIVTAEGGNILFGSPINRQYVATGSPAATWAVAGGVLPPGVTLSTSGALSGTPNTVGEYTFTIRASNATGNSERTLTLAVHRAPVIQVSGAIAVPHNAAFDTQLSASGYPIPTWELVGGNMPRGLTLSVSGMLSGTTSDNGTHVIFVTAANAVTSVTQQITLVVAEPGGGTGSRRSGNAFLVF